MGEMTGFMIGVVLISIAMLATFDFLATASGSKGENVLLTNSTTMKKIGNTSATFNNAINNASQITANTKSKLNSSTGLTAGILNVIDLPFQVAGSIFVAVQEIFVSFAVGIELISSVISFAGFPGIEGYVSTGILAIVGIFVVFTFINFIHARKPL